MRFVLFLVGMTLHLLPAAQPPGAWELKNEKDGVKVYYRKSSDIHEVKLTSSFKTSVAGLAYLLLDVSRYDAWGYKVTDVRMLKQVSPTEFYYYAKLDFPWPLTDRDVVMHTQLQPDPSKRHLVITSEAAPDMIPPSGNIIRIRDAHTKWTLFPGSEGWLYSEYEIYSNPGGNIPDWIVNMAIDVGPKETMQNIRRFLTEPKYQNMRSEYLPD